MGAAFPLMDHEILAQLVEYIQGGVEIKIPMVI